MGHFGCMLGRPSIQRYLIMIKLSKNPLVRIISREVSKKPAKETPQRLREFMKPLKEITRQLVIGTGLGDGYLRKERGKTQLLLAHTEEKKDYLWWKWKILADDNLVSSKPYRILIKFQNKKYPQWRCQTIWNDRLNELYYCLYSNGIKAVKRSTLNMLTPLGLAVWYMDDGNVAIHKEKGKEGCKSREIYLNTHCFSYQELLVIQKYFNERWKIKIGFVKNKGKLRIRMGAIQAKKLLKIVKPYILKCMEYKTNLGYKSSRNAELPFWKVI